MAGNATTTTTRMSFLGRFAGALSSIGASIQRQCMSRPVQNITNLSRCVAARGLSSFTHASGSQKALTHSPSCTQQGNILHRSSLLSTSLPIVNSVRNLVRYSIRKGLRKTVKAVPKRFFRLPWGIYIRPTSGRRKHRWKKNAHRKRYADYHVFCNKQQSRMLDKMTTRYWKKVRHFPDDPYVWYFKRTGMEHVYPKQLQPKDELPKFWP